MHRTQGHRCKAKYLKRKRGYMSSIKGVSHLSRRAKRRLYCKLQLWMWRRRREKCRFGIFRAKRRACGFSPSSCLSVKTPSQKSKSKVVSHSGCNTDSLGDTLAEQNRPLKLCESIALPQTLNASSSSQNLVTDTTVSAGSATVPTASVASRETETLAELGEITDPLNHSHRVKPVQRRAKCGDGSPTRFNETGTAQRLDVDGPSGQLTAAPAGQDQAANGDADGRIASETDASLKVLTEDIHEFLEDFYRIYGSFIPLQKSDVLRHLKRRFNTDFRDRTDDIFPEVTRHRSAIIQKPVPSFRVVYKKHTLTLYDLSTLADQNWLNDQVMNMYGELIMESTHHKVHFLNSFFHRQLMTKGYDGVKRWTKQVDLFSKSLLLVPVHLEVHWCLVSADIVKKKICLYDSQGNALQKVARNILKYLMAEAREKKQAAFENGWAMSFDENIPQQTNENDCGVFVLEYSRCLALGKPLQFSQKDIPKIRTRIYKELCDCKLHEEG